jgi:hypothetical protein
MYPIQASLKAATIPVQIDLKIRSTEVPEGEVEVPTENRSKSNRQEARAGRHCSWLKDGVEKAACQ